MGYARKSCNYLTEAVEGCSGVLENCYDEVTVTKEKDDQMAFVLEMVKESIKEWDPEKCPAVKAHLDRVSAKMNIDQYEDDDKEEYYGDDNEDGYVDDDEEDGYVDDDDYDDDDDDVDDDDGDDAEYDYDYDFASKETAPFM